MRDTWTRRATVAGIALSLGLVVMVVTASGPPTRTTGVHERQAHREAEDSPRARRAPLPRVPSDGNAPTGTRDINLSTDSGGLSVFECLGTVSHASIDNNFARLMDEARRLCGGAPLS